MLLLLGRQDGPLDVEACGEGDIDGVDVGVVQNGVVGAVDLSVGREIVGLGEGRRLVDRPAPDGVECGVLGYSDGAGDFSGYVGAAQNSESDWRFGRHFGGGNGGCRNGGDYE